MSECEEILLNYLFTNESIADTFHWANSKGLDHNTVVGAVKSLEGDDYVKNKELTTSFYNLSDEAEKIVVNGSQEMIVLLALIEAGTDGMSASDLQTKVGKHVLKIGRGTCMKNRWIKNDGDKLVSLKEAGDVKDETQTQLKALQEANGVAEGLLDKKALTGLKRRKLINLVTRKSYAVSKGESYSRQRVKRAADLTKEMLDSQAWKTAHFRPYNFQTLGEKVGGGYLHPLLKVRAEFRKILMQMGFEEMPTNKWVESSFWNFDSLFQPQSHPARDAHDTFFIKEPASTVSVPEDYYKRVKSMHEVGGSGSIGYRYDFKREEAFKNLLRTHTTAISSQMLYKLANQKGGFTPKRYFSIDRVFRNETMDATHLC